MDIKGRRQNEDVTVKKDEIRNFEKFQERRKGKLGNSSEEKADFKFNNPCHKCLKRLSCDYKHINRHLCLNFDIEKNRGD